MKTLSLDHLRRRAKRLRKAYEAGEAEALSQISSIYPDLSNPMRHADFLHVIARQSGFESWPRLKFAAEQVGLDRLAKQRLLRHALYYGQHWKVTELLNDIPDLPQGDLACQIALYEVEAVEAAISANKQITNLELFGRRPIVHLAFSRHIKAVPEKQKAMLEIADLLLVHGADVDDFQPAIQPNEHALSILYGAIGHGDNMPLAKWLLEHGADPNDGESLYHSTELGHRDALTMLLEYGADPNGTNALLRALDFNDHEAVRLLLGAGARPDDFNDEHVAGEAPMVIPALHQAARRMSDREMIDLLLDGGADPHAEYDGVSPYAYARVIGNHDLSEALEARGLSHPLTDQEEILADVAVNKGRGGVYVDPSKLPDCYRGLLTELISLPNSLDHIKRLVSVGIEYDRPAAMGVTPVQTAGWHGLADIVEYLLELGPDLSHKNDYGGALLGTILHGAENCDPSPNRDHIECARLALYQGVLLPKTALEWTGHQELAAFLRQWAEEKPSQVV